MEEIQVSRKTNVAVSGREPEPLWSTAEAAAFLSVPIATLRYWLYLRTGPKSYKVGRHRRYRRSDLEAWLLERAS